MKPLYTLDTALTGFITNKKTYEELFSTSSGNTAYMEKILDVVGKYSEQKTKDNYARIHNKQAELAALQSQINPHFLYNTLDSIRGQALVENNIEIARMVEALAGFFRYSISRKGELVRLRDEIFNVQNYMKIQQYRFANRFLLEIRIEKEDEIAYECLVPRLIIQPIVENSINHGLKEMLDNCIIMIEVVLTNNNLILTISDNGDGIESDVLDEINNSIKSTEQFFEKKPESKSTGKGIALININKRIQLFFGEEYGLSLYSTKNVGTDVEILLPANYESGSEL